MGIGNVRGKAIDTGGAGGSFNREALAWLAQKGTLLADPGIGAVPGLEASGGIITDQTEPGGEIYRCHTFTDSGTFTVTANSNPQNPSAFTDAEILLMGGGGGGGGNLGGGGGAGGCYCSHPDMPSPRRQSTVTLNTTSGPTSNGVWPVTIGAGGQGQWATQSDAYGVGTGQPSTFGPLTAPGGGGGGDGTAAKPGADRAGGSGGGGTAYPSAPSAATEVGPAPDAKLGFPSGVGGFSPYGAGGGGGAGEQGHDGGAPPDGANGGDGILLGILASPPTVNSGAGFYWGGGGGGAMFGTDIATHPGDGGKGGGGGSGNQPTQPAGEGGVDGIRDGQDGTQGPSDGAATGRGGSGAPATGSGGGGSCHNNTADGVWGGNGGSGICIIRYQIGQIDTGSAKATGGLVSFYNDKTIHTFYVGGTFTTPGTFSETCEYVVLAGGGGGAGNQAGGGGAGQYLTSTTPVGASQSFAVTVGAGGWAGQMPDAPSPIGASNGYKGSDSSAAFPAGTVTANGGGGGQSWTTPNPQQDGGSGGGGCAPEAPVKPGGTATPGPGGNPGGAGNSGTGGGGGGAGGAGTDATSGVTSGAGGAGIELPATFRNPAVSYVGPTDPAPSVWYVAGGGGGASGPTSGNAAGVGGSGGGGDGGSPTTGDPRSYPSGSLRGAAAVQFTGSGGGGGGYGPGWDQRRPGGNGAGGIVLIAYPT